MTLSDGPAPGTKPLRSIAVIGAGLRGRAFALRCMQPGLQVVLEDVLSSNLRKAEQEIAGAASELRSRLLLAGSVEDAVREADLAIDFVPDELESKLEIFSMMDRMAPPKTIFCTPTLLSIADLASCTYRPALCIGIVPFGDEIGNAVQVVRGLSTDVKAVQRVSRWMEALGVSVQVVSDAAEPLLLPR